MPVGPRGNMPDLVIKNNKASTKCEHNQDDK